MGESSARLDAAFRLAGQWVDDGVVPGVAVAVAHDGQLVGELYAGKQAAGSARPVDASTLYSLASATKPLTATALMRLVERGTVSLDEPVRRLVPALTGAEKRQITPRHLLAHTSGLPAQDPAESEPLTVDTNFARIAATAARLPLAHPPGVRVSYSDAAYWVLGAAIAAAAGRPFVEAMRAEALAPCGLSDTHLAPPATVVDRIARRYGRGRTANDPAWRALGSPANGAFATARDLVRFASILVRGGVTVEGTRVLSRATVALMTTVQRHDAAGGVSSWGLGWEVKGDQPDLLTGDLTSPRTVSHRGGGSALVWADPETGLACAVLANREFSTGWATTPARWARLCNAIVAALT